MERSTSTACRLTAAVVANGADRLLPITPADARFEAGTGAVLASRDPQGKIRVLLINRGDTSRTVRVDISGLPATPMTVRVYDDPASEIRVVEPDGPVANLPAESMMVVELQ